MFVPIPHQDSLGKVCPVMSKPGNTVCCLGAECMMWRTATVHAVRPWTTLVPPRVVDQELQPDPDWRGYCGLAPLALGAVTKTQV